MAEDNADPPPFWRTTPLHRMTLDQWESLCDGCAKCCLLKLIDKDTEALHFTNVACQLLDGQSCRCRDYANRQIHVPDCVRLSPSVLDSLDWMPSTCAYRLLRDGKDLPAWHPLVSGDPESVHHAGISVRGRVVSETLVDDADLEAHIVKWPE
ncbi:MAG: YcgN family cysteine cluster protein [Pseudomonadota bacterium]|nr:YcgN family cysteine cluster protein [Pseudomonadota bacterium]